MAVRAILMDFNGVIIDDELIQMNTYQDIFKQESLEMSDDEYFACNGMDDVTFLKHQFHRAKKDLSDEKLLRLRNAKTDLWKQKVDQDLPLCDGVENFIRKCHRKFAMGIVSMANPIEIHYILHKTGLADFFDVVITGENVTKCKPDPQGYFYGFRHLDKIAISRGKHPFVHRDVLVIEDVPQGIQSAKAAGMKTLAVTTNNPPNPYTKYTAEYLGEPPPVKLEIYEEFETKKIITKAWSSDFGHRFTVNCYRGCIHGCTYCFARQYHEYIGYGAGTDFETKIVVKPNAPFLLRKELKSMRQSITHLDFSFATDPYLPLEASYQLTRRCLEVCRDFQIPVGIITKSPLVTRDLDIFKRLKNVMVFFSIPFLTNEKSNPFEPYAPNPNVRFRAMKILSDAGIKTGIAIAPVLLGYNDSDIPRLLEKAKENGASKAFMGLVHFDTESIVEYFVQKLDEKLPSKAEKILNHIRRERDGDLRHKTYAERSKGKTEEWEIARKLFDINYKKLGFENIDKVAFVEKTQLPIQRSLF